LRYLLDTVAISDFTKMPGDRGVKAWFGSVDEDDTFLSVGVVAELRLGIQNRSVNRHGIDLEFWLSHQLLPRFAGRIIGVDPLVADVWGRNLHTLRAAGRVNYVVDALIGATARVHDLVVVTRNVRDFEPLGVDLLNPWTDGQA